VFIGVVVTVVLFLLHPQGATTDLVTFTVFANSSSWTAIHLGEFVGMALILAGLLILYFALNISEGTARWLGFFGAVAAGAAVALYGVAFAVDGVALKQAVDAWASAPAAEQAARFASAQAIQWLELGTKSYQDLMFGFTLVLFATVIVWTARISRPIGYFMGVIGLAFLVVGWLEGTVGFSQTYGITVLITYLLLLPVWGIWMLIIAWWRKESIQAAPA
jgi:hypothetical protein